MSDADAPFPPVSRAEWQAQAEKELGGRPLSALTRTRADQIAVAPLYLRDDVDGAPGRVGLDSRVAPRWRSVQEYRHADPEAANAAARRDLELGADGLWLVLDTELRAGREPGSPADGLVADPNESLDALFEGIDPARTPVWIDAGLLAPVWADALEQWLDDHAGPGPEAATLGRGAARGGVLYDPFSPLLRTGSLELPFATALTEQVDAMLGRTVGLLGISTCGYHDAGASDADELALALATCAELLRRGQTLGLELADLAPSMVWTLTVGTRPFEAIAKLRAARVCWTKFAAACGLEPDQRALWIHATASQRIWTRQAPWVNLLRGTIGSFAGAVGGADSVATAPFDGLCGPAGADGAGEHDGGGDGHGEADGLGRGSELGRRLALDTQVILRAESGLDRVADPAGGSWYVEHLTDALARAAWDRFRELEGAGGLVTNLCSGAIQAGIATTAKQLQAQVATRKQPITGVSSFPILADEPTPEQGPNVPNLDGAPEPLRNSPVLEPAEIAKLPLLRLAAPFERLRDASDRATAATGTRPRIYALTLGPLAAHQGRLDFAANLFGAAGLDVVVGEGVDELAPAVAGFRASGCELVVVCGRDPDYERLAGSLLVELRAAGAARVWIAGRIGDWGLDPELPPESIYLGCDALAACELAAQTLGLIPAPGAEA